MINRVTWIMVALAVASGLPSQETVHVREQPLVDDLPRQSATSSGSGWFSPNSFTEAMSVLFPVSGYNPLVCSTTPDETFQTGICLRVTDCLYYSGESYGGCGGGIGSCCVFSKQCDATMNTYVSYFVNPTFSSLDRGTGECKFTVNAMNANICQYRIDFMAFDIIGPDANSVCVDDFMGITGGTSVPKLCGNLAGQHLYVNVKPNGGPLIITVDTSSVKTYARKWNIKVTQIGCNSPERAPRGCLQFFNETSGTVRSFNFKTISSPDVGDARQIQNLKYGVCVNSKIGYCDVTWSQAGISDYTFTVSGRGDVAREELTPRIGTQDCKTDFVSIPGGLVEDPQTKQMVPAERFCGSYFPEVKTSSQPYVMHIVTDDNEDEDQSNLGFELNFRQNLCYS